MARRWIGPALALTLVACVYAGKIAHPFQWDDFHFIVGNDFAHDPANVGAFFTTGQDNLYRPLRALVYLALHAVAGGSAVPYHLAGIAFHLLTCLLVIAIAGRMLGDRRLGLLAGTLFGVHPVVVDRVANITGSLDIPGVTLALLAFLFYLRAKEGNYRAFLAASLASFALALLYSEEAMTLAPLVLVFARADAPEDRPGPWRVALRAALPYLAVLAGYLVVRTLALRAVARSPMPLDQHAALLLAMGVVFWGYVFRLLFPVYLSPAYGLTPADVDVAAAAVAVVLIALVVLAAFVLLRRRSGVGLGLAWFLVALLPFSNLVPIGEVMADRYAYHAAAGFAVAFVGFLAATAGLDRRRTRAALGVLLAAFCVLSLARVRVWSSPLALWGDAVAHAPRSYVARINHGIALRDADPDGARAEFEAAVAIDPARPIAHVNLGQLLLERRDFGGAARAFLRALQHDPEHVPALAGLANVAVVGGDDARARALARKALAIDGGNVSVHNVLAFLAYRDGRFDEAAREYEFVARNAADPRLAEGARQNLERLRSRGAGRP